MEEFARSSKDQNQNQKIVIRGKRTKRHRPVSALAAVISGEDDRSGNNLGSSSSPTTSGEVYESEEEDMANCLILLAQGGAAGKKKIGEPSKERHNSRKFTEIMAATAAEAAGKVGLFVYECKTCNRTFPSFQALGGHRASHKKPRTAAEEKKSPETAAAVTVSVPTVQSSTVADDHRPLSLQFAKANFQICNNNNNKIGKIHECSICGSEFTSGQALGGHMRRHRTAVSAAAATSATTVTSADMISSRNNILQLDLNLPAPEDDLRESSTSSSSSAQFQFASAKQSIVFSAPALVDCHY